MAKKYLKNENGIVRAITSDNLGLEKPLVNENYNIEVHNRNMDKIDGAVTTNKSDIATNKSDIATNKSDIATNKSDIATNKSDISNLKTKTDATNTSLSSLQTKVNNGQNSKMTADNGECILLYNGDANNITRTGFYMGENIANAPSVENCWLYIESKVHNNLYQNQIATDLHNSSKRWTRHKIQGTWSEWREL